MAPGKIDGSAQAAAAAAGAATATAAVADSPDAKKPPDDNRYVDAKGVPLPGGSAKEAFKRMPVYMQLKMDQREIPKLLVECANSPLPVEVQQLRINASRGGAAANRGGQAASTAGTASKGPGSELESYDVPVVICGIIYIYNPPDTSKLGGDPAAAGSAAPGAPAPQPGAAGG
jgi:hypothetical protein